ASRVSAGKSLPRPGRRLAGPAAVLFGLALLSGCDPDPYPADLHYPLRGDLLVVEDYREENVALEPLGHLEQPILAIREKNPNAVVEPSSLPSERLDELRDQLEDVFGTPATPTVSLPKS